MHEVEKEVRKHQRLYDLGTPELSDASFDELVQQLQSLDPSNAFFSEVGHAVTETKLEHSRPMLSLEKAYTDAELEQWQSRSNARAWVVEPKLDGISAALRYDGLGRLSVALTRGDGQVGDVITHNVALLSSVPKRILHRNVEIRGELVVPKSLFAEKWSGQYANTRNMAAGLMLRKTPTEATQDVVFVACDLLDDGLTFSEKYKALKKSGFQVVDSLSSLVAPMPLTSFVVEIFEQCAEMDIETDGVVVKVDGRELVHSYGATAHHPRWAIAYKRQGETGTTTVRGVKWQVARTGRITPVAEVEPVALSGVSVARATLHNLRYLRELALCIGDQVSMTRRGGVIPQVEAVTQHGEGDLVVPPYRCPECGCKTVIEGDFLFCSDRDQCGAAVVGQIEHWCKTLGMMGFGPEVCNELYELELVTSIPDLYRLDIDQMPFGKTAVKLIGEIRRTRSITLDTFIQGLGIDGIGKTLAVRIASELPTVEALLKWACPPAGWGENPLYLPGVGEVAQKALMQWLHEHQHLFGEILGCVTIEPPKTFVAPVGSPLAGKKVIFTGEMDGRSREEGQALVLRLGGLAPTGLTRDTDILVIGSLAKEAQRGKRDKAEKYNAKGAHISVLSEEEFFALIKDFV